MTDGRDPAFVEFNEGCPTGEVARLRGVVSSIWVLTVPRADEDLGETYASRLARIRALAAAEFYRETKESKTS